MKITLDDEETKTLVQGLFTIETMYGSDPQGRTALLTEAGLESATPILAMDAPSEQFFQELLALCGEHPEPMRLLVNFVGSHGTLDARQQEMLKALLARTGVEAIDPVQLTPLESPFKPITAIDKIENSALPDILIDIRGEPITIGGDDETLYPSQVQRWVDIQSPRMVHHEERRVPIVVRLSEAQPLYSAVAMSLTLAVAVPVVVRLTAPGFDYLNGFERTITLSDTSEGECVFDIRPAEIRTSSLQFDFFQNGHLLGTTSVPIEIVGQATSSPTATKTVSTLSDTPTVSVVDLMLTVAVDQREGQTQLFFTLQESGNPGRQFDPVPLKSDLATYATQFYEGLNRLAQGQDPKAGVGEAVALSPAKVARQLKTMGRQLWDDCLPPAFRGLYGEKRAQWRDKTLMIVSDEPYLPWEMVLPYDKAWEDEEPWCLTFQLTRWLRRDAQGNGNEGPPGALPWQTLAALAPVDSALPYAGTEVAYLKNLSASHALTFVEPLPLTWESTLDFFEGGAYNWVHLVGHGKHWQVNDLSEAIFMVEGGEGVAPHELNGQKIKAHFSATRPGVVFNICEGGRSGWSLSGHSGWANHFISYGAGFYLAPAWKVSDRLAYQFMETLYGELNQQKAVGEAVRSARRTIREEQNPAWLAYCVYAHPNALVRV
jgi:hypothetical protein